MKNKMIFFVLLVLVAIPFTLADGTSPVLRVSLTKYEPLPAQPGNFVDVWVRVENIGDKDAKDAVLQIVPEFPFLIDNATRTETIGILGSQKDYVVDFKIRVADDATQGTNFLKVRFTDDPALNSWSESTLKINVESASSDINIAQYATTPKELQPGQPGKLSLKIENVAGKTLRDIKMTLNLVSIQGSTVSALPFVPIGTTAQQWVSKLDPGETTDIVYDIAPTPDAISQSYNIPITLTYKDNLGNQFTKNDLVGVIVNSNPELMVTVESVQLDGKISIKIVNKGLSTLKFLTVSLKPSKDFDILSQTQSSYIGKLDSDDFETVDFQVAFKNSTVRLPLTLTFRDANNNAYEQNYTLEAKTVAGKSNTGSLGTIIIIVLVVAVVGFIIYRATRRKKQ
jgi:hypothetical protein